MTDPDTPPTTTRRSVLQHGTLAVGGVGFLGQDDETETETSGARATQRMVIPQVDAFEGNYEGQFVYVQGPKDDAPEDLPVQQCGFDETWPPTKTQAYEGQLLDRMQEEPTTAEIPIYTDDRTAQFESHIHFIVQNVVECPDGFVGLEVEWLTRGAVAGKEPGPTVTSTDGPGFGVLAAVLGGLGAIAYRAFRGSGDEP